MYIDVHVVVLLLLPLNFLLCNLSDTFIVGPTVYIYFFIYGYIMYTAWALNKVLFHKWSQYFICHNLGVFKFTLLDSCNLRRHMYMYVVTMGNIIFFIVWSCELLLFFQSFAIYCVVHAHVRV